MKFSRYEGFIFDLDGTLVDTFRDLRTAINLVRADMNMPPLDLETVTMCVGYGVRQLVQKAIGRFQPDEEERLVGEFRRYYRAHLNDESRLYDGVLPTLRSLSGRHLAVLSNKPHEACVELLTRLGVAGYFEIVRGQDSLFPAKPDPTCLLHIVRDVFGSTPELTLMVGDFDTDVQTARNGGVSCAIVRTGMYRHLTLKPDCFINDISDLSR